MVSERYFARVLLARSPSRVLIVASRCGTIDYRERIFDRAVDRTEERDQREDKDLERGGEREREREREKERELSGVPDQRSRSP